MKYETNNKSLKIVTSILYNFHLISTYRSIYFKSNAIVHTQMLILQVSALIFGHHQAILITHRETYEQNVPLINDNKFNCKIYLYKNVHNSIRKT